MPVPREPQPAAAPLALPVEGGAGVVARARALGRLAGDAALAPVYRAYAARLRAEVLTRPVPHHVALIMDGNRRWAREVGLREIRSGHRHGADKAIELLDWCAAVGIGEVTLWALSLENLARSDDEVGTIAGIATDALTQLATGRRRTRIPVRLRVIGRRDVLPETLRAAIEDASSVSRDDGAMTVTVALGYSGRDELLEAFRATVRDLVTSGTDPAALPEALTEEALAAHLYTVGSSDPDLIIRTSGEIRLSGFLPWQSVYSEYYFSDAYWPAFREIDFLRAIRTYQQRRRRFGR